MDHPERVIAEAGDRLVAAVETLGAGWVERAVAGVLDAWGRLDPGERDRAAAEARAAGSRAATRVADELRTLIATAPEFQRATPLEVIRSLYREPTVVLRACGVPGVVRDEYEERSFPDDEYGIVLHAVTELGDDDLGGVLMAWGMAKAQLLRTRRIPGAGLE